MLRHRAFYQFGRETIPATLVHFSRHYRTVHLSIFSLLDEMIDRDRTILETGSVE